jgi:hypothetical protein
MTAEEHDARMTRLARKVSHMLDGEDLFDVASVCALLATFAICEAYPTLKGRITALDKIHVFMLERISKNQRSGK